MATTAPPTSFLYWYRAKCVNVVDGDTADVATDLGFRISWEQRLRFYGINAYEMHDADPAKRALAVQGKQLVESRILGKDVILNTVKDQGDKYGRWLATIWYLDAAGAWTDLNQELVDAGLAVPYFP